MNILTVGNLNARAFLQEIKPTPHRRVAQIDRRCTTFEITRAERDDLLRDAMDMTQLERDACTLEELRALDEAAALIAKVLKLA